MKERVGLIATARKKAAYPAPVVDFYCSPLFIRTLEYAKQHYDRFYFFNTKDGLLLPDDIMVPYHLSIKNFSKEQKKAWAQSVVQDLLKLELPECITLYLHGGLVYREFLEPELKACGFTYEVPLRGYGIGEQLNWYKQQLNIK